MRKRKGFKSRILNKRKTRARFLIVCEGKQTEPKYFKSFRVNAEVETFGNGHNTLSLVNQAAEYCRESNFDQVWCVFDRDSFPHDDFNEAIARAHEFGFHVAFTNESFELWYLLHFSYYVSSHKRWEYVDFLSKNLGFKYEKNISLYEILLDRQPTAIRHAKKLMEEYSPFDPVSCNPSTTVHLLVEELNKHLIR